MSAGDARIRAVLFDLDGVLTTDASGSLTTLRHLHRATGIDEAALWDAFAPFNADLLLGRTTHAAAWPSICARLGRVLPYGLLDAAFRSTPMNAPMLDLARRLRRTVRTGIVTDNKRDRVDRLVALHSLDDGFDPIVVSADVGRGKDAPAIFEHALHRLGIPAASSVFVDNTPRNLDAPAALGLHVVHFDDARNDVAGLAALLRERFGLAEA